jgi:hypothetical protein
MLNTAVGLRVILIRPLINKTHLCSVIRCKMGCNSLRPGGHTVRPAAGELQFSSVDIGHLALGDSYNCKRSWPRRLHRALLRETHMRHEHVLAGCNHSFVRGSHATPFVACINMDVFGRELMATLTPALSRPHIAAPPTTSAATNYRQMSRMLSTSCIKSHCGIRCLPQCSVARQPVCHVQVVSRKVKVAMYTVQSGDYKIFGGVCYI